MEDGLRIAKNEVQIIHPERDILDIACVSVKLDCR